MNTDAPVIHRHEFELLREFVYEQAHIVIPDEKIYLIRDRLGQALSRLGFPTFHDLYHAIAHEKRGDIIDMVIDAVTTGETFWFRDPSLFTACHEWLFERLLSSARERGEKVSLWSAACSTGQEPYSLAMALLDWRPADAPHFTIDATDISPAAIELAKRGYYSGAAIGRGMDNRRLRRYFFKVGGQYEISPFIKRMVTFRQSDLFAASEGKGWDLILLRNVATYFSPADRVRLFEAMAQRLNPGGLLALGSLEHYPELPVCYRRIPHTPNVYEIV